MDQGPQWPASSYSPSSTARSLSLLDGGELRLLIDRQRELSRQHRLEEEEQEDEMFMEDDYEDTLDCLLQEAEDFSIQEDDMAPEEAVVLLER